ncbi:ninjurin-1 isoform X2 [Achroia grisella]|uniref:ninjurin-1 isoform X2 n=1 Tax=Achroia grisella TaxID=688607 RepID=UPI0027D3102C|nr:ninjurin-1 isoform X2 [Achroia grisella]
MAGETEKIENSDASENPTVNIEDIVYIGQNAPTEIVSDDVKGLDANRYATKKTVAQGMLDIALLTSNASQLKYVLQVGPKHEFYTLLVVLISISIVLQASAGVLALIITFMDEEGSQSKKKISDWLYHVSVGLMTGVVFCDVIKMTFGLDPALSEQDFLGNRTSNLYDYFSSKQ